MNHQNLTPQVKIGKSILGAMLLSGVIFVNLSSTKPQIIQKPETKTHKPNKPPKRVVVDFEFCDSREDIINLFKTNNALKTINIQDYFLENQKLLSMVDMDDFGDFEYIYNESDIMRYAIYTQLSPKSQIQNINILNREIAKKSDYASYIYIKNSLTIKNFDSKCEQIAKAEELAKKLAIRKKRQKANPGKKYKEPKLHKIPKPKIEKDIPLGNCISYQQEGVVKIPRRQAYFILKSKGILVNSSSKLFDETGNNKTVGRTCLHGIQKNTLDFLTSLSQGIESEYSDDISKYSPIVVTGVTENGHADSQSVPLFDHPSGAKVDLSAKGIRGVILASYFADFGVTKFDHIYQNIDINRFVCDIHIHDGGNGIHFDILVKKAPN